MAGRGRGRGRGLVIVKPPTPGGDDPEGKPVASVEPTVKKEPRSAQALNDLKSELTSMLHENDDLTDDEMQRIEQLAVVAGDVQETCKMLYSVVKEKRTSAKAVATVCDRLANLENEGTLYRSAILRLVQGDYKGMGIGACAPNGSADRELLRGTSNDTFLSCLSLLSHLFVTMRLANGEVMQPLVGPIYDCLELIAASERMDDSEAETLNSLLLLIGRELQDNADDRMQELMMNIRNRIIEQTTKPQVRCYLLEVLETYARRWQLAPNDITRFYIDVTADIYAGLVLSDS